MGLYGVILSTVVATLIVGMPWLIHNLFTTLFDGEDRQKLSGDTGLLWKRNIFKLYADRPGMQSDTGRRNPELLERALVCLLVSNGIFLLWEAGRISGPCWQWGKRFLPEIPHDKAALGK